MNPLQAVVAYWRDCIKAESALEQSFGVEQHTFALHERAKASIFTGTRDPFIFATHELAYFVEEGKLHDKILRAALKGQEIHFGYPMLMFYDRRAKQHTVVPLFTIRLTVEKQSQGLLLKRGEPTPTLGSLAFSKLGLNPEEIVALNAEVSDLFAGNKTSKLEVILYLLNKQTKLTFVEGIDPEKLSLATDMHPYDGTVVYNKAVITMGDASIYNVHLLGDLDELLKKPDIPQTSLKYLLGPSVPVEHVALTPVLPFQFDEYHLQAIRTILNSERCVVTGPPGTGKSQFIANLIVNLFLQKKRVLFVSHTSEAVRVVNERVNAEFANLMMQTGKKDLRQDLGRRLEELVREYNEQQATNASNPTHDEIARSWREIGHLTDYLAQTNGLHKRLAHELDLQQAVRRRAEVRWRLSQRIASLHAQLLLWRLSKRLPNQQIVRELAEQKTRHIVLSRAYVKTNYLALILENGLYGELVAYIDALQNKRFINGSTSPASDKYIHHALAALNIWSCTLKSLGASFPLQANLFDYVIFDEASQIDLPSAAPALYRAKRMVVVGDENQLNHIAKITPKVEEKLAAARGVAQQALYPALVRYTDTSLFTSAKKSLNEPELELKNHYRSNVQIANLFSSIFYSGKLRVYEPESPLPPEIQGGVYWVDVKGAAYKHKAGSRYNTREATYVIELLKKLLPVACARGLSIGVATPYSKQQDIISDKAAATFTADELAHLRVLTVHKFQGSEVDILLFSPVLAKKGDDSSDYWYTRSKELLNVAISRAKHLLLIVGDRDFALQSESKLRDIARYCDQITEGATAQLPTRPMNIFERKLYAVLRDVCPDTYQLEPQYVLDGRFTLDFALLSKDKNIAIELDGQQHEIIGGLPVFEDRQRDAYLTSRNWVVIRITVYEVLKHASLVQEKLRSAL